MGWSDYRKVKEIGSGSFGKAYLVSPQRPQKDQQYLVMKEIDMHKLGSNERKAAELEAKVLHSLKHPYIVRYTESFVHDQVLCIVMEYCEGGDLWKLCAARFKERRAIAEPQVLRWFTQMCLALKHMHDKNILHRDIKTQNVFLSKRESKGEGLGIVKIADFGIAKVLANHHAQARTQVGTPYYLSPEVCQQLPYAMPSDVWALGCVLYELCALHVPFEAQDMKRLLDKICKGAVPRIPNNYSKELSEICFQMFARRQSDRPSAEKLLQRPMVQAEIKKMLNENKKPEGEQHDERGRQGHGAGREPSQPRSNSAQPRAVLQERNHSRDHHERNKPGSRAPSPQKEAAKHMLRQQGRSPSPAPGRSPSPGRHENQPPSARHYHQAPRQGYPQTPRQEYPRHR